MGASAGSVGVFACCCSLFGFLVRFSLKVSLFIGLILLCKQLTKKRTHLGPYCTWTRPGSTSSLSRKSSSLFDLCCPLRPLLKHRWGKGSAQKQKNYVQTRSFESAKTKKAKQLGQVEIEHWRCLAETGS